MRFLQYALLACFILCIIAEEDEEEENEETEAQSLKAKPQEGSHPAAKPEESAKPPGTVGGSHTEQGGVSSTAGVKKHVDKGGKSRRSRCEFTPQQGNCAGSRFLVRWWFNKETGICESFKFPVCNNKAGAFLSCKMCMQRCLKNKKGAEKARWINKVCLKKS
nr:anticoagulant protein rhipilin-1-like isoform X1 [Dermacentor andersoni]